MNIKLAQHPRSHHLHGKLKNILISLKFHKVAERRVNNTFDELKSNLTFVVYRNILAWSEVTDRLTCLYVETYTDHIERNPCDTLGEHKRPPDPVIHQLPNQDLKETVTLYKLESKYLTVKCLASVETLVASSWYKNVASNVKSQHLFVNYLNV